MAENKPRYVASHKSLPTRRLGAEHCSSANLVGEVNPRIGVSEVLRLCYPNERRNLQFAIFLVKRASTLDI